MPVMGLESELLLSARSKKARDRRKDLAARIVGAVPKVTCCVPGIEGPGSPIGYMLGSTGGRIYQDVGHFVEHATPEVRRPEHVLATQRANELILLDALRRAARAARIAQRDVSLIRTTKDYADHYSGLHLNFSTRRYAARHLIAHLTPFLVTRYYARAGGFNADGFVMSHKNAAVRCVASEDTRNHQRGVGVYRY